MSQKCTDGWEGGSGGSKQKLVKVHVLDNLLCICAVHNCHETFLCSQADPKLWQDYQHYGFDFEPFRKLNELNQENNSREQDTPLGIAAVVKYLECHANNGTCNGHPVFRHLQNDKQQIIGNIKYRECPAGIIILTPIDQTIRKAVVVPLSQPHNHPSFKPDKLTIPAKESWQKAVAITGAFGLTVTSVDKASTTAVILGSDAQTRQFQCLANSHYKSNILGKSKRHDYPYGLQFEGVVHLYQTEVSKLPIKDQYIHAILSKPCIDNGEPIYVIVTMVQALMNLLNEEYRTIVSTLTPLETDGIAISRVYCNRKNRQAFWLIWRGWMEAICTITEKLLAIKALYGEGRHVAFLIDSCAAQIQGLGGYLLTLNDPAKSGIITSDAEEIVQYVIWTCDVHCNRNLDALGSVCTPEDMDRIHHFQFLSTQEEMDAFITFCQNHPHAKVKDWITNKLKYPWYLPSLCHHFSKIPPRDWDLTPADMNLNETSHPATNCATGINLPLLEAIQT
ncbi:hypothetical protein Clacol_004593 [Clathrus columnatus]|uniref:Uncharacterized protein n=1 Tax=Clathrus columnatus TaxID=1419009 RepID=A0AAV5A6X4_9AGAM|nr:hypothetical protein Clacol_004593 [Clathrus columnatus]